MNVPTKQQLRDEIEQLKEDLYTAMDGLDNKDLFYKLASKNMGYYHWYFEREAERQILEYAYPDLETGKATMKGIRERVMESMTQEGIDKFNTSGIIHYTTAVS